MRYATAQPALLQAMHKALQSCKFAADGRNSLVHGSFDHENGRVTLARRGRTTGSLTLARIEKATAAVFEALRKTLNAFPALGTFQKASFLTALTFYTRLENNAMDHNCPTGKRRATRREIALDVERNYYGSPSAVILWHTSSATLMKLSKSFLSR
jgi:hypothetical protein